MSRGLLSISTKETCAANSVRGLVARSLLPCLTLDVSHNDISVAVERIADWLERTGGLSMPDQAIQTA